VSGDGVTSTSYSVRRLTANASAALVGEAVSKGAAFVATLLVARSVSAVEFGQFSFVLALVSFALLASDVGLQVTATRAVAADRARGAEYATASMVIGTLVGAALYVGVVVLAALDGLPAGTAGAAVVFGAVLVLAGPINAWWSFLRGFERQDLVYGVYAISAIALVVSIAAVVQSDPSLEELFAIYLLAYGVRLALSLLAVRRVAPIRVRLTRPAFTSLLVAAPAVALAYGLQEVYSHVDVVLLGFLVPAADVGSYAAAYRLIDAVTFLSAGALSAATFPVFSRLARDAPNQIERLYDQAIRVLTAVLVPLVLLLMIVAPPLVDWLYSFESPTAARILTLLAPSALLIALNFTTMYFLLAVNRVDIAIAGAGAGAIVNIVCNVAAVPLVGVEAAAAATFVGECVVVAAYAVGLGRTGFSTHAPRAVMVAAIALIPPIALAVAVPSQRVVLLLLGIPFAMVVMLAGRVIRTAEVRQLIRALRSGRPTERMSDAAG
jgi:O-antigen/teichoic acid export membrane protein